METSLKKILMLVILLLAIVSTFVERTQSAHHNPANDIQRSSQKYRSYVGFSEYLQSSPQPYSSYAEYQPEKWCCGFFRFCCP